MQLGDARLGKFSDNLTGFTRALRRSGLPLNASSSLAQEAALCVGLEDKAQLGAALESVLLQRPDDRFVFRELFDVYFTDPQLANKLLSQMLPQAESKSDKKPHRDRIREALAPQVAQQLLEPKKGEEKIEFDASLSASQSEKLRYADFETLTASEYRVVERLAREIRLPLPMLRTRRWRAGGSGSRLHWSSLMQDAATHQGDILQLRRMQRRTEPLPLLILIDVSGSMERYARLLISFLHASTQSLRQRQVFAFSAKLTDLSPAFKLGDSDAMLASVNQSISDYASGTHLANAIATLRQQHPRSLHSKRSLVLLISDGLDTAEPAALDSELTWLKRHSRQLFWLNPLMGFSEYQPSARCAAVLHRHADQMLAVHNLSSLQALAQSIALVLKTP